MSAWVGMGQGTTSDPILQAGSESDPGKTPYLWWEAFPHNSIQKIAGVAAGNSINVFVNYVSGAAVYNFYDFTTGYSTSVRYTTSAARTTAEWIAERDIVGGTHPYLAKFSTYSFTGSVASYSGATNIALAKLTHHYVNMATCNQATLMAYPGPIASNGENFSEYWTNYGDNHVC